MDKKFKLIFTMVDGSEHSYPKGYYKSADEAKKAAMRVMDRVMDDFRFVIYDRLILNAHYITKAEVLEIVEKDV